MYKRSENPDLNVPLSREALKVFTAIRGETSFKTIQDKTKLDRAELHKLLAELLSRGLIRELGAAGALTKSQVEEPWQLKRREVVGFLNANLKDAQAASHIARLQACIDAAEFSAEVEGVAKRIALAVDERLSKQLLEILES